MAEENKQKMETQENKLEKQEDSNKVLESKTETKPEAKAESKKEEKKKIVKKEEAIAKGINLKASKKHCMYICSYIKNKPIDIAIKQLQEVVLMKRLIPMKGEIPHKHGPGVMSARYPISSSKEMIYLLKSLKGNVLVNGMDLDKTRIYFASATWDSRPAKKGGARFKRTHVLLKAKEVISGDKK